MRSKVTAVMSGVSVVVVALSLRAAHSSGGSPLAAAPAGIVATQPVTPKALAVRPRHAAVVRKSGAPAVTGPPVARRSAAPVAATRPAPAISRPAPRPAPSRPPARPSTVTVNGSPADTQYGPVQVQITLRGGHIIRANAIEYPNGSSRDQEINSQAIPQLNDEAVQADSSSIDTVSGATYTSEGYRQSLQSAIDAAHRAGVR